MKECFWSKQAGFTLIEVMVAITLLAVGILAVASMQITAVGGNDIAVRITEASTGGEEKMEDLMNRDIDHDDLKDDNGDGEDGLSYTDEAGKPADGSETHLPFVGAPASAGYTVFWNVADDYPITVCKTIRVIVRRSDKGALKMVTFDFVRMETI